MTIPNLSEQINQWAGEYESQSPQSLLKLAFAQFKEIAISFSGAEDVVLIDMAHRLQLPLRVFSLDTGRLHSQTYRYLETVRTHYNIQIEVLSPQAPALEKFTKEKGFFSFYQDGHEECCQVRKVEPLRRQLATLDAWVTGQRKDQAKTRVHVPVVQLDTGFGSADKPLVKFNPLANWSSAQVWDYIRGFEVPYNALHEQGFVSIGCEPCTRPVLPTQHERDGRWWWESAAKKECGLHAVNLQTAK